MRIALIGYGNVARSFVELISAQRKRFPFRIAGAHTRSHGTAYGWPLEFGPPAATVGEFLDRAQAEVLVELSSLEPETGEPALSHIREAFARGMHVVTANKGPLAHAYGALRDEAAARGVQFRFESTVMDGTPVFNMVRNCLPGVTVQGFSGALNSTTKIIFRAMAQDRTYEDGVAEAIALGIAEADPEDDVDGWDAAVKTAALANVLMNAGVTPHDVAREGIGAITANSVRDARDAGEVYVLVSRAESTPAGLQMSVRPERLPRTNPLATTSGTTNVLLLHTDLMGTVGAISIEPGVAQTAYGILSDLVDITRTL